MTDLNAMDLEVEAKALVASASRPKRRVSPRLARQLADAEDLEVDTPFGSVMAWRLGAGPATLLVHGWEDDNALWGPLIGACAEMFRAVVVLDLPGHGFSQAESCTVETAGEAILAVAEALGPIDSIVGHSFGCSAATYAMSRGLPARRAAMIAGAVLYTPADLDRFAKRWIARQVERGADPEVAARADSLRRERQLAETPQLKAAIAGLTAAGLLIH
ncbi:MAG: alpha/beta fold hydrolase, partial [Caulobacteraceae bacterium]|nr:alpha/beta fold hydrolase [Caulobacteraceae bacterium]